MACDLTVCGDRNSSAPISGNDKVCGEHRKDAQFGTGQGGGPGDARGEVGRQLSPERPGLADQGAEVGEAAILVVGVIWSFVLAAVAARRSGWSAKAYLVLRQAFGGTLLLGLIVVIRTFLSFSLETEIEGVAPWRRAITGPGHSAGPRPARWNPRRRPDRSGNRMAGRPAVHGSRTSRPLALPCSTSAMASFTPASGLVS